MSLYSAPNGRPFIIHCLGGELTSGAHGCPVSYRLRPYLSVFYKVNFARTSIDDVIPLDRALREAIETALVKDYPWPEGQ
jgi:hypothetical protein